MDDRERAATVRQIAREGDSDRYAAALFAPAPARRHLFSLYAFNSELAGIGGKISEPQLGAIRLQWWRDAVGSVLVGELVGNPVADALGATARQCGLSEVSLVELIDARQLDLAPRPVPDMQALRAYLDKTAGALFRLAAEAVAAAAAKPLAHRQGINSAARAAGFAYGLAGLMRSLPVHAAKGRVDIPAEILERRGVMQADIVAGNAGEALNGALAELREMARTALGQALSEVAELPTPLRTAFLPLALVEPYLAALEKVDPLREIAEINPLYRLWRLATFRFPAAA